MTTAAATKYKREFKYGWFGRWGKRTFQRYLPGEFRNRLVRYLEIGVWEGASCCWIFDHLNVDQAIAVDPWTPIGRRHPIEEMNEVCRRAKTNLQEFVDDGRLRILRESSTAFWKESGEFSFNLIYIDGDHSYDAVILDSVNAWQRLEPGGIIIWDDYHKREHKTPHVPQAVDKFLDDYAGRWEDFYTTGHQRAVRKIK